MRYNIICNKCKSTRQIDFKDGRIDWLEDKSSGVAQIDKIISARTRFDGQLGFQCVCGNNDLHTSQELRVIENQSNPKPQEIEEIMKNLKPDKPQFEMVAV